MASQTIGEAAAIPPAALALAANDDFAEVMFAGVMEDRFLFRRVGEGGGFGPSSARRSAARIARRRPSGSRWEGVSTYTACRRCLRAASRRRAPAFRCRYCARYRAGSHRGCARLSRPGGRAAASAHRRGRRCGAGPARAADCPRKKFSIARSAAADVDLPSLSRWRRSSGEVHQHHVVRGVKEGSGTVSRTCTPVIPLTTSFRLSRCWTLTVVKTSIPASSSSSTSCQRFGWRSWCCAPAHPPESAPDGARAASRSNS